MIPFNAKIQILTKDINNIYGIHKPAGIKSIPNTTAPDKTALIFSKYDHINRCYTYNDINKFFILNRLDSPTSGLMLGCDNIEIAIATRKTFQKQKVTKKYLAITKFRAIKPEGTWKSTVTKLHNLTNVRLINGTDMTSVTKYKVLKEIDISNEKFLLLSLQPITGRTHQLRMHCATNNMHILGDKTYGDFKWNNKIFKKFPTIPKRLYLHSMEISFDYRYNNTSFHFTSQDNIIADFEHILDYH